MSEEAILAETLDVLVVVERDGKQISIPLSQWLDEKNSK